MDYDLQLQDYADSYRFACWCRICKFTWYERPATLQERPGMHSRMYLSEVEKAIMCPRTRDHKKKARQHLTITPIRERKDHHFIGGLA